MKYEQLPLHTPYKTETKQIRREEIMEFASTYDPQYMHVDETKAANSMFGGIIASGLHTLSISFRMFIDLQLIGDDIIGGVSIDKVKFLQPVYPDDRLTVIVEIIDKKPHKYKPDQGFFKASISTYNQDEQKVLSAILVGLVKRSEEDNSENIEG